MMFLKCLHRVHRSEKGFTLIELLIVILILGSLSGVVTMNVGKFVGVGEAQAKEMECDMVELAALAYMIDSDGISESFTVGPDGQGPLDSYLIGNLKYSWTISAYGNVSPSGDGDDGDIDDGDIDDGDIDDNKKDKKDIKDTKDKKDSKKLRQPAQPF